MRIFDIEITVTVNVEDDETLDNALEILDERVRLPFYFRSGDAADCAEEIL